MLDHCEEALYYTNKPQSDASYRLSTPETVNASGLPDPDALEEQNLEWHHQQGLGDLVSDGASYLDSWFGFSPADNDTYQSFVEPREIAQPPMPLEYAHTVN